MKIITVFEQVEEEATTSPDILRSLVKEFFFFFYQGEIMEFLKGMPVATMSI